MPFYTSVIQAHVMSIEFVILNFNGVLNRSRPFLHFLFTCIFFSMPPFLSSGSLFYIFYFRFLVIFMCFWGGYFHHFHSVVIFVCKNVCNVFLFVRIVSVPSGKK